MSATAQLNPPPGVLVGQVLAVLRRYRIRVALFVFAVGVLTGLLSYLIKPWYTAEAKLLPPQEGVDAVSNLAGLIESSALNRIGLFTTATASDILVEILKSRRLRESLIRKFDLQRQYEVKNMETALKVLDAHISVKAANSGVVIVRTEAMDKRESADMANFLVAELDRFNREVLNTRGKRMRQFMEERLAEAQRRMGGADSALTAYERRSGVLVSTDESGISAMGELVARRIALQVRRGYLASFSSPESPEVRTIEAELQAFDRELGALPQIKNEGQRLALDATIQHKVFALLSAQYEQARVDEMRDIPTVTVLDEAIPPDLKTRPKRSVMVLSAMLVALLGAAVWAWWSVRPSRQNA